LIADDLQSCGWSVQEVADPGVDWPQVMPAVTFHELRI